MSIQKSYNWLTIYKYIEPKKEKEKRKKKNPNMVYSIKVMFNNNTSQNKLHQLLFL